MWMPYNWGFQGLSTGPSVNHLTIDAVDPGAGTQETKACLVNVAKVRDGGEPGPCAPRENVMDAPGSSTPDQDDADRHHQVHRLPRMPGRLQAMERARRGADRAAARAGLSEPRDAEREDLHPDHLPRVAGRDRLPAGCATPSPCGAACTACSRRASRPARPRPCSASRTGRSSTTPTSASGAATACWPAPGTCPPRNGTR